MSRESKVRKATAVGCRMVAAERVVDGILVNPTDPPESGPHAGRAVEELLTWWRLPFIVSRGGKYDLRVLDCGAHDRTNLLGRYDTAEAAAAGARAYCDEAQTITVVAKGRAAKFGCRPTV